MSEKATSVTDIIGEWGFWQANVFLFCLLNYVLQAFNSLSFYFFAPNINFWCADDPYSKIQNYTTEQKCGKYSECREWEYEKKFHSTIIDEWDLVCDQSWLSSMTQSVFMFGYIPAGLILCLVADRIGRKPLIWFGFTLELFSGLACIFSNSIWQFIVARFFMGIGISVRGNVLFALFFESCGKKYRGDAGLFLTGGWVFGIMILSGLAYIFPNFRWLGGLALLILVILMFWSLSIDESVRWQITHKREKDAIKTLRKALKMNGKSDINEESLRERVNELGEAFGEEAMKQSLEPKYTILDLFKTPKIRSYTLIMFAAMPINAFIYYGISFGIGDFGGDLYVTQILAGLAEIPGLIISLLVTHHYGRRFFTSFNMVLCGLVCLIAIFTQFNPKITIFLTVLAKFFITNSYNVMIIQTSEIFPTVLRTAAGGSITVISRFGAMSSPFVTTMIRSQGLGPILALFACLSICGGFLAYFLPETQSKDLPDTIEETEKLG
ncbi:organic cation transporter protein-like [Brevipalpus obovatus]|uniref:organic cation transporter protein-like n=1 Tax=Brevipalpus obovatus TaxID=246614 RepID=UPI003D9F80B4